MAKAKINIRPIGEYILVKPLEEEETTASGLILQSSNKGERPQKGEIVALGTGARNEDGENIPFNIEVGQIILFKKYSPEDVEVDNQKYLLMKESDILAVINS